MKRNKSKLFKGTLILGLPMSLLVSCNGTNNVYTISFYDDDTLISTINTKGNENISLPNAPKKDNYEFKGWFLDKGIWSEELTSDYFADKPLLENINSYAFYEEISNIDPVKHTISFYVDDILFTSIETSGNELISLPSAPKKDNYEFKGWFFDNNSFKNELKEDTYLNISLDEDVNVYSFYEDIIEPVDEFKVTFETNGGNKMDPLITSLILEEPIPTKKGCTFLGWYLEKTFISKVNFPFEVTKDITLYAKWEENTYNVHFELNGGKGVNDLNTNEILVEPIPTKEGYTFLGWYLEKTFISKVNFPFEVTKDITLYAKWEENTYNVHFELNGGKGVNDLNTNEILVEPIPTKEGYTFLGWYLEKTFISKVNFPFEVTKDITLYAKWEEELIDNVIFNVNNDGVLVSIDGINEKNNEITIPMVVNDIEVKEIGEEVFLNNKFITKLVIPETVKTLGYKMCQGCVNLKEVVLPNTIEVIPDYAFEQCNSLSKINIPTSLVQIRNDAFSNTAIKEFNAPNSFKEIWNYAFKDCKELETVNLNNTSSIGDMSFENCISLKSIEIPETITEIGTYAFSGCSSLMDISLPSNPINLIGSVFYGSGYFNDKNNWVNGILYIDNYLLTTNNDLLNLNEITVKEGTIVVAENAFTNNGKNLTKINLPEGLKFIGKSAFSSLYKLESINIPSTVTSIGYGAFSGTTIYDTESNWENNGLYIDNWLVAIKNVKMTEFNVKDGVVGISDGKDTSLFPSKAYSVNILTLPDTLKYIGVRSFARLKITEIILPKSIEIIKEGAFYNCSFLSKVNLGECPNLTYIGSQAFSNCSIEEITIPAGVEVMGELVFNLNSVDLLVRCMVSEKPSNRNNNWDYTYKEGVKITVEWN